MESQITEKLRIQKSQEPTGGGHRLVSPIMPAVPHLIDTTTGPGSASQRPHKVRPLRSGKFYDLPKVTGSERSIAW